MARSINRFFSPRVQAQFTPQFVEEEFPFQEAFLVGAGQQKRIDEQLLQAQALEGIQTRPIAEDVEARDKILSDLQEEKDAILARKGGDPGVAAQDIAKAVMRAKPKFAELSANLAIREEGLERRAKLDDPLIRQGDVFTEPTFDPDTGLSRIFQSPEMIETPDFVDIADDRFGDISAQATERISKVKGPTGKFESVTSKVLTDKKLRQIAKDEVDGWLRDYPWWGINLEQMGVQPNGIRKATEDFLYDRVKFKAQNDTSVEYVAGEKEEEAPEVDPYEGMGIGSGISGSVVPETDIDKTVTRQVVTETDPKTGDATATGESRVTLVSDNSFTIRKKNGDPFTLLISPDHQWDTDNFGERETNVKNEDFELQTVQDYITAKRDIPELGIKKGDPIPEEEMGQMIMTIAQDPNIDEEVKEQWFERFLRLGVARPILSFAVSTAGAIAVTRQAEGAAPKTIEKTISINPEDLTKDWFASGRIHTTDEGGEKVVKNKIVPYEFVKSSIKASTAGGGTGGFEIDESAFFDDSEMATDLLTPFARAQASSDEELKASGWTDEQIATLRSTQ